MKKKSVCISAEFFLIAILMMQIKNVNLAEDQFTLVMRCAKINS